MGKSIQKRWFGLSSGAGNQIVVNGVRFADNSTASNAYIIKQTGDHAYVVQDTAMAHAPEIVFMVNATGLGGLLPGQCYILATPFGGSALPCKKIAQYRVDLYETDGTVDSYSWSAIPATGPGQADLISGSGAVGAILSIAPGAAGFGYFTAPSVSFTGGGAGAAATATVANGVVTGYILGSSGLGYLNGNMTIGAPTASVTATASSTVAAGSVTGIAGLIGGGYYAVAPNVVFDAPPALAAATATVTQTAGAIDIPAVVLGGGYYDTAPSTSNGGIVIAGFSAGAGADVTAVLTNGAVTSYTVNNPGAGYDSPVSITIGSPATVNTVPNQTVATATATVTIAAGAVTGIAGLVGGFGYFTAPLATFDAPPAAVQATASATISV